MDPGSVLVATNDSAQRVVGRQNELAVLRDRLTRLAGGTGAVVLIGGATGIGKTTLVEVLRNAATAQGATVLAGGCYDLTVTPPYGPWIEITESLAEGAVESNALQQVLSQPVPNRPGGREATLFTAVRDCLASIARRRLLLIVLEDLHWADPASIELFRRLSRIASTLPALLVATYRTEEVTRQHSLYLTLPVLVREAAATEIELRPLGDDAVRELVTSRYELPAAHRARLVAYLQARAEGNPFFVQELLRELEADGVLSRSGASGEGAPTDRWELGALGDVQLPRIVRQVLERRLDRIAQQDRHFVAVAAVIGQEVPLALWAEVLRIDEEMLIDVVERVIGANVLVAARDGATARFAHALVREVLYDALSPPRRRIWHARVAEALLSQAAPDPDSVAYHLQRSGDTRTAEWLVRAAVRAQTAYAWVSAAERYQAALECLKDSDAPGAERARLMIALAQVRRYTSPDAGIAHLTEAERLARAVGDPMLEAAAQFDRGHLRCMERDFERGLAEMKLGLAGLDALAPAERSRAPCLEVLGVAPDERQHYHRGVLVLFQSVLGRLAEARASGVPREMCTATLTAREWLGRGWVHAAGAEADRAREAFANARLAYGDQHWEVGTTYFYELDLVVLPYQTDRLAERRRLADEAESAWRRASGALSNLSPRLAHLPLLLVEGQWAEARELAVATLATPQSNDAWRRYPGRFLGWLAREQGDPGLAWGVIKTEFPAGPATPPGATWFLPALELQRLAAALAIDAGDLVTARAWLDAHDRWLAWSGAIRGRPEGELGWAAWAIASGQPDLAQEHATRALDVANCPRQPLALLAAHRTLGELATSRREYEEAAAQLEAALELATACNAPLDRALTLLALAELRRATGDRLGLDPLLVEVTNICGLLDARRALARVATFAPRRIADPETQLRDEITARELDVLILIARGSNNQEIADQLVLSVRTVERHVNNLYRKINARGRADAVAYAARHGLL